MTVRMLTGADEARYDVWIRNHPQGNLWQSLEWRKYQESLGRKIRIYCIEDATSHQLPTNQFLGTALVVIDRTTGGLSTWDIPYGPLWIDEAAAKMLLDTIVSDARNDRCLAMYCSPMSKLSATRYPLSARLTYPQATRIIDLTQDDEAILSGMHQKGRYNIKVAEKNGVTVEESREADAFAELVKNTSQRDNFTAHTKAHYTHFLANLPGSFLLMAYNTQKTPIAGLMGVVWGTNAIYYYGASNHEFRALMAPYLLQWEAIKLCKAKGCTQYDLFGIAPPLSSLGHPWQGISSFKEKFGGSVVTYEPEQQIVLRPVMMRALQLKRKLLG